MPNSAPPTWIEPSTASTKIEWKPELNARYQFKWEITSDDYPGPNGVADIHQEETDTDIVKDIQSAGNVVVQEKVSNIKATLGGNSVQSKAAQELNREIVYRKNGAVLSWHSDSLNDEDNPRFDDIERLIYPDHAVNVGDNWSYKEQANPSKGTRDNLTTYGYEGHETVNGTLCYKVVMHYQESGTLIAVEAHGTFWIAADDGELMKKDIRVENLTVGNGARPFKLHLMKERI